MAGIRENKQGLQVLFTGAILQLFLGIIYVWSVFVAPVSEYYGRAVSDVKLTSSFMLCFFVVGILLGGKLQGKFGAPKVVLCGGLLLAFGMLATAFIPKGALWLLYISYGIVGGFGVGMAYNAIISAAQKWFPKNRGFATGVSVCAFGFSTVIFAPLVEALVSAFGLQGTFLMLSGAFFLVVFALFSFIKLPDDGGVAASAALSEKKQYTMSEALKTWQFYFITFSLMFATAAFFILNPSFKTLAAERGLDAGFGTLLVMITGVANALGRLFTPLLSDKIGREKAAFSIIFATALCAFALCFASGVLFMAVVFVIAFCYGGYSGIYPVITADYFGIKNVGSNYGAVMVGFALSALCFPMLIGAVQQPVVKFIVLGALALVGGVLVLVLQSSKKKVAGE